MRQDMKRQGICKHLKMTPDPENPSQMVILVANYILIDAKFNTFCDKMEDIKVPIGYCVDIGNCIWKEKFGGLKSHDYHVFMQMLLPIALHWSQTHNVPSCMSPKSSVDYVAKHGTLHKKKASMKMWPLPCCSWICPFHQPFFDIMSHLSMHLVEELFILGPMHVQWMYSLMQTMGSLKNQVKNKARPEASIAHGYLRDKTMRFLISYMEGYDVIQTRVWDAKDSDEYEVVEGADTNHRLTNALRDEAHRYVLWNNTLIVQYAWYVFYHVP